MTIRPATPQVIDEAGQLLRDGGLVAMPTETVYGLAADATNGRAVAAIYATKGRPQFNPLIVHVASLDEALHLGHFTDAAVRLARAFWPGPLTLVVPARVGNSIAGLVTAGLDTIAIRVPAHPVALALIAAASHPLAAPSANRSGRVSPTTAAHVAADFATGDHAAVTILDGGPTLHGLESTIIACSTDACVLLRPGALPADAIAAVAGMPVTRSVADLTAPIAPGQLASHYAPVARVRLNAVRVLSGEALLAFGPVVPPTRGPVINLSATGDLIEAAHTLFGALRALDASGVASIAVMPIPTTGLGEAINDRLARSAAPR
jgi:L-threonylcarbamoyladenylate synthase